MEASTKQGPAEVLPETAGLPLRPQSPEAEPEERPSREDALEAASTGKAVTRSMEDVLMGHFFGEEPAAGSADDDKLTLALEVGHGVEMSVTLRPLDWAEWRQAQEKSRGEDGRLDEFFLASWTVAATIVNSPLGRIVDRMQRDTPDTAPTDAPALLRRFYRRKSGVLISAHVRLLELSGLSMTGGGVREVEAAKA